MRIIADFHIHSKYSRATSHDMDLEHIFQSAQEKGITIVGTGDFTHPEWFNQLKNKLESAEEGLYRLKDKDNSVRFVVTGEISNMYTRNGSGRRIHSLIILPSLESAEKINNILSWQGNIKSDGRPILGMDTEELLKIIIDTEPNALFVPAHCMTPWFGIFGSMSGFDSLEEAFGENAKHIYAMETGLSADPAMIWRIPDGRKVTLISNSDAHSPTKLGREVNVFDTELSYSAIREAIIKKDKLKFLNTIEFFPQEGKYHYDGHRLCNVSMSPEQRKKVEGICPKCGRKLTVGVLSRVDELADRKDGFVPPDAIPYKSLVPLREIIAEAIGIGPQTKGVDKQYQILIQKFSNEFNILLDVPFEELSKFTLPRVAEGIKRVRNGKLIIEPGYDGEFGKVKIFQEEEKEEKQDKLF
ncbi:MAG TPA: endonuclease Q family protein [Candidatus Paceibacterota bacterium]|nr:endonuclease Q family protein [Candidatus Paceibacterota bacterium]